MRKIKKSIIKSSIVLMLLLLALVIAFLINILTLSDKLINSPYNKRLNELRKTTAIGSIYDRNNVTIAGSLDGERVYHSNAIMRNALSHLIGDTYGYCPTGADIRFASILLDYNESLFSNVARFVNREDRSGDDITLTVDSRLNIFAYNQMKDYNGAAVLIDYKTGEILSLVSTPSFDPKSIINDLSINQEKDAFVNRAIQGQYAPGSLFQIITAGTAIEYIADIQNRQFNCSGSIDFDDETIYCDSAHGQITLQEAFAHSCDTVFAQLGVELGAIKLNAFSEQLKFNYDFNYSDIALSSSSISISKKDDNANLAYAAIGQHETLVSPMHMAMITGAIANDGIMISPTLLKAVDNKSVAVNKYGDRIMPYDTAQTLQGYMQISHEYSHGNLNETSTNICSKEGVAVSSKDDSLYPNSWFVGYVNDEEHSIAICIILEQSYVDENPATQVGKKLLDYAISIGY